MARTRKAARKRSRKGIGGPKPKSVHGPRTEPVYYKLHTVEHARLSAAATAAGLKVSEFARKSALDAAEKALGYDDL